MLVPFLNVCLFFLMVMCNCKAKGLEEGFVNPFDMTGDDNAQNFQKEEEDTKTEDSLASADVEAETVNKTELLLSEQVKQCQQQLRELRIKIEKDNAKPTSSLHHTVYFNFRRIVTKISSSVPQDEESDYIVYLRLDGDAKKHLRDMAGCSEPSEGLVHDAGSSLFDGLGSVEPSAGHAGSRAWYAWFRAEVHTLSMVLLAFAACLASTWLVVRLRVSWGRLLLNVVLVLFLLSIAWNWVYLYKKALASRRAAAGNASPPPQCHPERLSWQRSLQLWITDSLSLSTDPCTRYYEAILVDPVYEVDFTQAVSETLARLLLQPATRAGDAMNLFLRALLDGLPPYLWPVALIASLWFSTLGLVLVSGYKIRVFPVMSLEPARPAAQDGAEGRAEMQALQTQVESLQHQLEVARSAPQLPAPDHPGAGSHHLGAIPEHLGAGDAAATSLEITSRAAAEAQTDKDAEKADSQQGKQSSKDTSQRHVPSSRGNKPEEDKSALCSVEEVLKKKTKEGDLRDSEYTRAEVKAEELGDSFIKSSLDGEKGDDSHALSDSKLELDDSTVDLR